MMTKAEAQGLQFYENDRDRIREAANAHGKLYDSRAGLAAYYRYKPRDMMKICRDSKADVEVGKPKIHVSALRRAARATDGYAPANIPKNVSVVGTYDEDNSLVDWLATAFKETAEDRDSGLNEVRSNVSRRRSLYFLFLAYSLGILLAAAWFYWFVPSSVELANVTPPRWISWVFDLIEIILPDYLFGFFHPLLEQAKVHWVIALIVMAVLLVLVILKFIFERASRRLALDAWHSFRETAYPDPSP